MNTELSKAYWGVFLSPIFCFVSLDSITSFSHTRIHPHSNSFRINVAPHSAAHLETCITTSNFWIEIGCADSSAGCVFFVSVFLLTLRHASSVWRFASSFLFPVSAALWCCNWHFLSSEWLKISENDNGKAAWGYISAALGCFSTTDSAVDSPSLWTNRLELLFLALITVPCAEIFRPLEFFHTFIILSFVDM